MLTLYESAGDIGLLQDKYFIKSMKILSKEEMRAKFLKEHPKHEEYENNRNGYCPVCEMKLFAKRHIENPCKILNN